MIYKEFTISDCTISSYSTAKESQTMSATKDLHVLLLQPKLQIKSIKQLRSSYLLYRYFANNL